MTRLMQMIVMLMLVTPVTAGAFELRLSDPATYDIQDTMGYSRNATGDFQGPGFSAGVTYGPFAVVNHSGFEVATLGRWYVGLGSRIGGEASRNTEGQKAAVPIGVSLLRVMGVDFIAAYNVTDNAWTPTVAFSGAALLKTLTGR